MGATYADAFDVLFEELAKKYDTVFYPFFFEGVAAQAKFALRDGVHPNAAGVDAIVLGILPKAEELIARIRKSARQLTRRNGLALRPRIPSTIDAEVAGDLSCNRHVRVPVNAIDVR